MENVENFKKWKCKYVAAEKKFEEVPVWCLKPSKYLKFNIHSADGLIYLFFYLFYLLITFN